MSVLCGLSRRILAIGSVRLGLRPRARRPVRADSVARVILGLAVLCAAHGATPARAEDWAYATPDCPAERSNAERSNGPEDEAEPGGPPRTGWLACYAPTFVVSEAERAYNRIGSPVLRRGLLLGLRASVDPEVPAVFVERREDRVAGRRVWQLVYRVHFEKIPLRPSRYFFEAHRNPGLMAVLTVDVASGQILFVSTVHTCGCYFVVVPTDAVDASWLPEDWSEQEQRLYGQRLPTRLPADEAARRLVIFLESQSHRVTAIRTGEAAMDARSVELPMIPMARLESLPVEGHAGRSGSFFYDAGPLRGHVRGAWNPMEGLTVFGWISLDPTVGMDKRFGDPDVTGTRFYTLLPFWLHERSRLDRFDTLLRTLGFRLPRVEPPPRGG